MIIFNIQEYKNLKPKSENWVTLGMKLKQVFFCALQCFRVGLEFEKQGGTPHIQILVRYSNLGGDTAHT